MVKSDSLQLTGQIYDRNGLTVVKRVVIKLGSALFTTVSKGVLQNIAFQIQQLQTQGIQVILVSSGAVALGKNILALKTKPKEISLKQACASIGQVELMIQWAKIFGDLGLKVAQVLVTKSEITERESYTNLRRTIDVILKNNIIPIINENDAVTIVENKIGNNDQLCAEISGLMFSYLWYERKV